MDPAEMSKPEKLAQAIQYRGRGHALPFISAKLDVPISTLHDWLMPYADEIGTVARETLPEVSDDVIAARIHLRQRLANPGVEGRERDKCAAILLANASRMVEVAAKSREADAATSQAKTADELRALEAEAQAYLAEVAKRQK